MSESNVELTAVSCKLYQGRVHSGCACTLCWQWNAIAADLPQTPRCCIVCRGPWLWRPAGWLAGWLPWLLHSATFISSLDL